MSTDPDRFAEIVRRVRVVPGADHHQNAVLRETLLMAVPFAIWEQRDASPARIATLRRNAVAMIASHGDDLQFGGKHTASTAAALIQAIALLARAPGGVTFAGIHACLEDHDYCPHLTIGLADDTERTEHAA
ncbi:hypothetical protein [Nocardia farcinica]|uniref:hypothetical protein n=1 Tax=Nocardia farcinica TaxID=37329 RepID=UPI0024584373|nr:hypothetical protein [Nocardia farcinica]